MQLTEYLAFVESNKRSACPNPKASEDTYGQPNIMELETERLYQDEEGNWCYKAAE